MDFVEILTYYINHNFALVVLLVGFLLIHFNHNSRLKVHSIFILVSMFCSFVLGIFQTLETCFGPDYTSVYNPIVTIATICGYILRPIVIFWVALAFHRGKLKWNLILAIPLVLNAVLAITSPWTHLMFYYDSVTNAFIRGPLTYTPHVVSLFYMAMLGYLMIRLFRRDDKLEGAAALFVMLACGVAAVLETLSLALDILNTTIAAACLFYYLFMFTIFKKRDMLTGVLDRRTFYADYAAFEKKVTALIGFDLNGLKAINDEGGHDSGDKALVLLGDIFLKLQSARLKFYRLGGDEFEAICLEMNEEDIRDVIAKIGEQIEVGGHTCAIGYALKENGDDVDALLKKADDAMYVSKREYYKTHERRRS